MRVVLATLLLLAPTLVAAGQPAHHPLVERAVALHGGDLYEATEATMTIASASGSFDLRVRRDGGLFEIEVEGAMADGTSRRALLTNDGVREWRGGEELTLDAAGAARSRRFVEARVWFPFLPYGLLGDEVRHQDQGLERWGERSLHRVKVTFATAPRDDPADEYAFWLDPQTGRVEQYAYAYDQGTPQAGLRFRVARNHRRIGGLLFFDVANLGLDERRDLSVDLVDPAFAAKLKPISEVELSAIEVTDIPASSTRAPPSASKDILDGQSLDDATSRPWAAELAIRVPPARLPRTPRPLDRGLATMPAPPPAATPTALRAPNWPRAYTNPRSRSLRRSALSTRPPIQSTRGPAVHCRRRAKRAPSSNR